MFLVSIPTTWLPTKFVCPEQCRMGWGVFCTHVCLQILSGQTCLSIPGNVTTGMPSFGSKIFRVYYPAAQLWSSRLVSSASPAARIISGWGTNMLMCSSGFFGLNYFCSPVCLSFGVESRDSGLVNPASFHRVCRVLLFRAASVLLCYMAGEYECCSSSWACPRLWYLLGARVVCLLGGSEDRHLGLHLM